MPVPSSFEAAENVVWNCTRRRPAILRPHIHDKLVFHFPLNGALAKGNPVNIGSLLDRIQGIG